MSGIPTGLRGISMINILPFFFITHQPEMLKSPSNPLKPRIIA